MRVVVHVGPHKTGSTYLQHCFEKAENEFEARGWLYPAVGRPENQSGHHELVYHPEWFLDAEAHPTSHANFAQVFRRGDNILFSAEGLCVWKAPSFNALQALANVEHLDLVYVIRNPYDLFYSTWKEEVKQGHTLSLPERFMGAFNNPHASRILNPLIDLRKFRNLESKVKLHLIPYDLAEIAQLDLYELFVSKVLDLSGLMPGSADRPNSSHSIELTEFLRLLIDEYSFENKGTVGRDIRHAFYKLRSEGMFNRVQDAFAGVKERRKGVVLPAKAPFLSFVNKKIIEDFADSLLIHPNDGNLFPATDTLYTYYDRYDFALDPEIRKLIVECKERIRDQIVRTNY